MSVQQGWENETTETKGGLRGQGEMEFEVEIKVKVKVKKCDSNSRDRVAARGFLPAGPKAPTAITLR